MLVFLVSGACITSLIAESELWSILIDKLVPFYGPAKFVAKLREMKTDDNLLLLKCRSDGGHRQMPGR